MEDVEILVLMKRFTEAMRALESGEMLDRIVAEHERLESVGKKMLSDAEARGHEIVESARDEAEDIVARAKEAAETVVSAAQRRVGDMDSRKASLDERANGIALLEKDLEKRRGLLDQEAQRLADLGAKLGNDRKALEDARKKIEAAGFRVAS